MNIMQEMAKVQAEIDANWRKIHNIINKAKMENNNYYPLRVGKYATCIVSDMPSNHRNKKDMDSEFEHYGGFVIAESIPAGIAKEFVDLYNKKYAPKEENSAHSFTEGMDSIGRKTICTQPECDCIEQAEKKAGGPVKRYECLARDPADEMKAKSSPKSFTIDEQIESVKHLIKTLTHRYAITRKEDACLTAVVQTLMSVKRWNETPVYHGEIDVAKVIEDLINTLDIYVNTKLVGSQTISDTTKRKAVTAISNGESAIDMINRFKEEREAGMAPRDNTPGWALEVLKEFNKKPNITAKDVAEAHHAGVDILKQKQEHSHKFNRAEVLMAVAKELCDKDDFPIDHMKTANAIIYAIESMDRLKQSHGK